MAEGDLVFVVWGVVEVAWWSNAGYDELLRRRICDSRDLTVGVGLGLGGLT